MANQLVKVILSAVDDVTGTAKKAAGGVGDFVSSTTSYLKGLAATAAAVALGDFFKKSLEEASKAEEGMHRLGIAVTHAGGDFATLRPQIEETVSGLVRLTTATDDDLRAALTNMITVSGDSKQSLENLGLAADVAAFKHIGLEEAGTLVGKAMAGNSKVLKEFGIDAKNVADPVDALRTKVGGFAEAEGQSFAGVLKRISNNFGEVLEATGKVILGNTDLAGSGNIVVNTLGNLATWIEANEAQFRPLISAVGAFVGGLIDLGKTIYVAVQPALGPTMTLLFKTIVFLLGQTTAGVKLLGGFFSELAAVALTAFGQLVTAGGKVLKLFGVDVVEGYGKAMLQSADNLHKASLKMQDDAAATAKQSFNDLFRQTEDHHDRTKAAVKKQTDDLTGLRTAATQRDLAAEKEAQKARERVIADVNTLLNQSMDALNDKTSKQPGLWRDISVKVVEAKVAVADLLPLPAELADHTEKSKKNVEDLAAALRQQQQDWDKKVSSARIIAGGLIDAAQAMGILDSKGASTLNTVVNMGAAIARMGVDQIGGIMGVIGGLASLISSWGNSATERHRTEVMEKNSAVIAALTSEVGDMNLSVSGKTFSGVLTALQTATADSQGKSLIVYRQNILSELAKQGLTAEDLQRVAKGLGIDISTGEGLQQLLGIMQNRGLKPYGGGFSGQLAAIQDKFSGFGVTDADAKLGGLKSLFSFSPALQSALGNADLSTTAGITTAKGALQDLLAKFTSNQLSAAQIGMAPGQFRDFVLMLLSLLGEADAAGGGLPAGFNLNGLASGGLGASTSVLSGFGGLSGIGTGLGVAGGGSGAGLVQNVQGDVSFEIQITTVDGQTAGEVVDELERRVIETAGKRYITQRTALGLPVSTAGGIL